MIVIKINTRYIIINTLYEGVNKLHIGRKVVIEREREREFYSVIMLRTIHMYVCMCTYMYVCVRVPRGKCVYPGIRYS